MHEPDTTLHGKHHGGGHEERDITFRPIVLSAVALIVLALLVFVGMRVLFNVLAANEAEQSAPRNPLAASYGRELPPEPRLQTAPIQDLQTLHAREEKTLSSYGWVDEKAGTVRIPVTRAMELLLQRGAPAREQAAPAEAQAK